MSKIRKGAAVMAVAASLMLAGCGGISLAGSGPALGLNLGMRPTMRLAPGNCMLLGNPYGPGGLNAAILAGERQRQVHQLQSRFSLVASDIRVAQSRWRAIVESGC